MEGSLFPVECLDENSECSCGIGLCDTCVTRPVWEKIYDSLWGVVDSITIKDLAEQYKLGKSYI
jgi:DNA-binding IscR family transcriptional regulator